MRTTLDGGTAMTTIRVPPPWFRLLVITPIVFVGCVVVTVVAPVLHLVLVLIDLVDRRRWRFSRVGGLGIAVCVCELIGLVMAFGLWVASGFGWAIRRPAFQHAHHVAFGWYLELLTRALRFYLGFRLEWVERERVDGPVVALARHAGPGDAFLLARTAMRDYGRRVRMLGTTKLLWDPVMDRLMRRLPYYFCDPSPERLDEHLTAIGEMCRTLDDDGVLIIFPEGGNWTPARWSAEVARLDELGLHERAERIATTMTHVMPPRSSGAIAALQARDDVTLTFVVHVGLDDLHSLGQIWRSVPLHRTVLGGYWSVPLDEIPVDPDEMRSWLFDQWEAIDQWIVDHHAAAFGDGAG